ncbi:MerR family transcriptional regulator [Oceanirhabdus seepicola]|uniref:MerR family transcriptional regulator n=1 Tax=Oceanirhabdus seepicola TaxID=2828781 RepID=A0A9J6NZM6_9CLOT|nr:MerR family transcriptional regulator [Oceanirhabdus seepicola]
MKREYLISEIAKMFNITKRTLQYYDKIDLLQPAFIKENGYRVYGDEELAKLIEILLWKNIGLESCDIKRIFKDKNPENIGNILDEADEKLNQELQRVMFSKENIRLIKKKLNNENSTYDGIKIKELEKRKIIKIKDSGESLDNFSDILASGSEILRKAIDDQIPFVEFGFIFDKNSKISEEYNRYSCYFFTVSKNYEINDSKNLCAGSYACLKVEGYIKDIDKEIKRVLSWMEEKGYKVGGDIIYSESFKSLTHEEPNKTKGEIQILLKDPSNK